MVEVVGDVLKEPKWETYHFIVLYQHHVICAESSTEDNASDTLKTMDPLLSLRSLATHIEHPIH